MNERENRFKTYPEVWIGLAVILPGFLLLPLLKEHYSPLIAVLALVLFMLPGMAVVCLLGDDGNWWERLGLAFVASLGVCGVVSQVAVFLHTSLTVYVWSFFILTGLLIVGAAVRCWRDRTQAPPEPAADRTSPWLIAVLLIMIGALATFWLKSPTDGDQWDNLAWIQNIRTDPQMLLIEPRFEEGIVSPRFYFSDWLVHQAMMSEVTGLDPVDLFRPQGLFLILLSLAAVYRLARKVSGRRDGAAVITIFWIFYLLLWDRGTVAGYEVTVRSSLDKVIAGFIIVPIGLSTVLDLFNRWRRRDLVWLLIISIAAALTHPISGALFGLALAGFAMLELFLHRSWQTLQHLIVVAAILLISFTSSIYLVIWGLNHPGSALVATSLTDTRDPSLSLEVSGTLNKERIYVLDSGAYVMHPSLILQPVHILAFLALPFLFLRRRRSRAACLLFGMLIFITLVMLFPPLTDAIGTFVTPSLIYRLHWPLSLAAVMTVGWVAWELLQKVPQKNRWRIAVGVLSLLIIAGFSVPIILSNLTWLTERQVTLNTNYCELNDPLLRPFQTLTPFRAGSSLGESEISSRADSNTVLGDNEFTDFCLVAYAPYSTVVEFHGTNGVRTFIALDRTAEGWQRLFDAQYYWNAEVVDEHLLSILDRWKVHYLIVGVDSPLESQLRHLPGLFHPVKTVLQRTIYEVIAPLTDPSAKNELPAPIIQANSALSGQDFSKAIDLYRELLNSHDTDTHYLAALGLGRAYLLTGRIDEALAAWQEAGRAIHEAQAFALQGEAYALQSNGALALQAYQQAVDLQPDNDVFQTRLGDMAQAAGQTDQAEKHYQAAATLVTGAPNTSNYYNQIGQQWFNAGNAPRALAAFQQSNQISEEGSTYAQIGQVYQNMLQWTEAEAAFRKMLSLDIWDWSAHTNLGVLYNLRNDNARAAAEYRDALRLNPLANGAYHGLAGVWANQGGTLEAIRQFANLVGYRLGFGDALVAMADLHAKAGQHDQSSAEAQQAINWYRLGTAAYKAAADTQLADGKLEQAIASYQFVNTLDVNDADAYLKQAQAALSQGDMKQVEGYTLRAILASPDSAGPYLAWANFYNSQARPDLALPQYRTALSRPTGTADAVIALGEFQLGQNKFGEATSSFQKALEIQPSATAALRGLGAVQRELGHSVEATTAFSQAVQSSPGDAANHIDLAGMLVQAGNSATAIEQLKSATELDPGNASAYVQLGDLYQKAGRAADAERVYRQLIANLPGTADGYVGLGSLREQQGKQSDAEAIYRQGLQKVAPGSSGTLFVALADLQRRQGHFDLANASYRSAITQQPILTSGYVALAQYLMQRSDIQAAADIIQSGLQLIPGASELNEGWAAIQIREGHVDKARLTLQRFMANSPASMSSVIALANLNEAIGLPQEAVAAIDLAQQSWPGNAELLAQGVPIAIAAGEPHKALTWASQLISLAPGQVDSSLALGQVQAALGQFGEAEKSYRQAAQLEPGSVKPWLSLGQFLLGRGKLDEANDVLKKAVKADQRQVDPHLALADIADRQGRLPDALSEYQIAAQLDATQDMAWLALGQINQRQGNLSEARQNFDRALAAAPTDPQAYNASAGLYIQQNKIEEARQELTKAIAATSGSCESSQNLGKFLADRGEWASAEMNDQHAKVLPGCAASAAIALGNAYLVQGQFEKAVMEYQQAIAAHPGDPWAYVVLADVYSKQAQRAEATNIYSQAIAAVPASDLLYAALGQNLVLQDKVSDGLAAIRKATELDPSNALNFDTLGRIYRDLGQFQDAERSYQQAVSIDHRLPQPYLSLGDLYARQGRFEDAQVAYKQAIEIDPSEARGYTGLGGLLRSHAQPQEAMAVYQQGIAASRIPIGPLLALGDLYGSQDRLAETKPLYLQALAIATAATTPYNDPAQFQDEVAPAAAQVYVALGDWYRLQPDWKAAEQAYRNAIKANPIDPSGYIALAQLYQLQGRQQEALDRLQVAVRFAPASAQVYVALGNWQRSQGNWKAAEQAYQQATEANGLDASGHIGLGQLYQLQGRQQEAATQFQAALQTAAAGSSAYVALGNWQRLQGNLAAAEQSYQRAIEINRIEPAGYIGLGQLYQIQGRKQEALDQFQTAIKVAPASTQAYVALGDWYQLQTDWKAAEQAYQNAIVTDRIDPSGYLGLGQIYQLQGRQQEASAQFQAAIRAAPASASAYIALGDWEQFQGNWDAAKHAYQDAIRVAPTVPDGYLGLSKVYRNLGQPAEALGELQSAAQAAPTSTQVLLALGDLRQSLGDWSGAIQPYQQAIALAPTYPDGYISLGQVYQARGRWDEAIAQFQEAMNAAPASAHPYIALGSLYTARGDLGVAQTYYLTATLKEPTYGAVYHAAGDGYRQSNQTDQALTMYRKGIEMAPIAVENYLALGETLLDQGHLNEARDTLTLATATVPGSGEAWHAVGDVNSTAGQFGAAANAYRQGTQAAPTFDQNYLDWGQLQIKQAQTRAAEQTFKSGLALHPTSGELHSALGALKHQQGDLVNAHTEYRKAILVDPTNVFGYIKYAKFLLAQGETSATLSQYLTATQISPLSAQAWSGVGDVYQRLGRFSAAAQAYLTATSLIPDPYVSAYGELEKVNSLLGQTDATALNAYRNAAKTFPGSPIPWLSLGNIYLGRGNLIDAQSSYQHALDLEPSNMEAHSALARVYQLKSDWASAKAQYDQAIAMQPGNALAHLALGDGWLAQGNYPLASLEYRRAISLDQSSALPYLALGTLAQAQNNLPAAVDRYQQATVTDPTNLAGWLSLGEAYQSMHQLEAALTAYAQAGQVDRSQAQSWLLAGQTSLSENTHDVHKQEVARADYEQALAIQPGNPDGHLLLADLYMIQDLSSEAYGEITKALSLAPGYSPAYGARGRWWASMYKFDEAIPDLERAAQLDSTQTDVYDQLVNIFDRYNIFVNPPCKKAPSGETECKALNPKAPSALPVRTPQYAWMSSSQPSAAWLHGILAKFYQQPEVYSESAAAQQYEFLVKRYPEFAEFRRQLALLYEAISRPKDASQQWSLYLALAPKGAYRQEAETHLSNLRSLLAP
jgi:tetratricopeptide (TPR) repeat protein